MSTATRVPLGDLPDEKSNGHKPLFQPNFFTAIDEGPMPGCEKETRAALPSVELKVGANFNEGKCRGARNHKEVVNDPEPIVDRDPNDGLLDRDDPNFTAWVEWHLSRELNQDQIDELRSKLEVSGHQDGLDELNCLVEPTRHDFQRLQNMVEMKQATTSDLKGLTW